MENSKRKILAVIFCVIVGIVPLQLFEYFNAQVARIFIVVIILLAYPVLGLILKQNTFTKPFLATAFKYIIFTFLALFIIGLLFFSWVQY